MKEEQLELFPDFKPNDIVVRLPNGRLYRCECGCNVFQKIGKDIFRCNGCQKEHESY